VSQFLGLSPLLEWDLGIEKEFTLHIMQDMALLLRSTQRNTNFEILGNRFTAAQTALNVAETLMYVYYLYICYAHGTPSVTQGRGSPRLISGGFLSQQRSIDGKQGVIAVLVGYTACVMTVSKTVLYCE
jgi:hypothetical protein